MIINDIEPHYIISDSQDITIYINGEFDSLLEYYKYSQSVDKIKVILNDLYDPILKGIP